jgi:hypothetical protein
MRSLNVEAVNCHSTKVYIEETLITEMLKNKWGLIASQSGCKNV